MRWDIIKILITLGGPLGFNLWYGHVLTQSAKTKILFFVLLGLWVGFIIFFTVVDSRLRNSVRSRRLEAAEKDRDRLRHKLEYSTRLVQHIEAVGRSLVNRVLEAMKGSSDSPRKALKEALRLEECINDIITEIYGFFDRDSRKLPEQFFRVSFMMKKDDNNLSIVYHQTPGGVEPISKAENRRFPKHGSTTAGYVWATMKPYLIDDIPKYLNDHKRQKQDVHFKYLNEEQEKNLKGIFCVPVYEEPKVDGKFYGVICIDTSEPGWFSSVSDEDPVSYHMVAIKLFLRRIIYTQRVEPYL